ncbi:MAG: DoxX family protein [Kofleriaceae bacterium]
MAYLRLLETISYVVLRIVSGSAFAFHGMQKILGIYAKAPVDDNQMWIGGLIELVGGLFIAFGFLTRGAALIASGTMAVAYIQFHWKLDFGDKFFPALNGGELALIYCFLFLFVAFRGGDAVSVDRAIFGRGGGPGRHGIAGK